MEVKTICYVVQYAVQLCSMNLFFWISCLLVLFFNKILLKAWSCFS